VLLATWEIANAATNQGGIVTDEDSWPKASQDELLVDIEARLDHHDALGPDDAEWLIDRVRALTAERDQLIVERDAWKIRVTG
jgi:hypothetical protein